MKRYISIAFWTMTAIVGYQTFNTPDKGDYLQHFQQDSQNGLAILIKTMGSF